MLSQYENLWKSFIRPARQDYSVNDLGPSRQLIGDYFSDREDFVLTNTRTGNNLQCSMFVPVSRREVKGTISKNVSCNTVFPCVVYCHANSGCRIDSLAYMPTLIAKGIALCCFDFAGSGLSDGDYVTLGFNEQHDLKTVVEHLRNDTRISTIALQGRSMGAVTILMYAEHDCELAGIVVDSPFANLNELAVELARTKISLPNFLLEAFVKFVSNSVEERAGFRLEKIDLTNAVSNSNVPALFIASPDDKFVRIEHSIKLQRLYKGESSFRTTTGSHNAERSMRDKSFTADFFFDLFNKKSTFVNNKQIRNNSYDTVLNLLSKELISTHSPLAKEASQTLTKSSYNKSRIQQRNNHPNLPLPPQSHLRDQPSCRLELKSLENKLSPKRERFHEDCYKTEIDVTYALKQQQPESIIPNTMLSINDEFDEFSQPIAQVQNFHDASQGPLQQQINFESIIQRKCSLQDFDQTQNHSQQIDKRTNNNFYSIDSNLRLQNNLLEGKSTKLNSARSKSLVPPPSLIPNIVKLNLTAVTADNCSLTRHKISNDKPPINTIKTQSTPMQNTLQKSIQHRIVSLVNQQQPLQPSLKNQIQQTTLPPINLTPMQQNINSLPLQPRILTQPSSRRAHSIDTGLLSFNTNIMPTIEKSIDCLAKAKESAGDANWVLLLNASLTQTNQLIEKTLKHSRKFSQQIDSIATQPNAWPQRSFPNRINSEKSIHFNSYLQEKHSSDFTSILNQNNMYNETFTQPHSQKNLIQERQSPCSAIPAVSPSSYSSTFPIQSMITSIDTTPVRYHTLPSSKSIPLSQQQLLIPITSSSPYNSRQQSQLPSRQNNSGNNSLTGTPISRIQLAEIDAKSPQSSSNFCAKSARVIAGTNSTKQCYSIQQNQFLSKQNGIDSPLRNAYQVPFTEPSISINPLASTGFYSQYNNASYQSLTDQLKYLPTSVSSPIRPMSSEAFQQLLHRQSPINQTKSTLLFQSEFQVQTNTIPQRQPQKYSSKSSNLISFLSPTSSFTPNMHQDKSKLNLLDQGLSKDQKSTNYKRFLEFSTGTQIQAPYLPEKNYQSEKSFEIQTFSSLRGIDTAPIQNQLSNGSLQVEHPIYMTNSNNIPRKNGASEQLPSSSTLSQFQNNPKRSVIQ